MDALAFLSLDGSLIGQALPIVLVGSVAAYFVFVAVRQDMRYRRQRIELENSVDPNQANTEEMLLEAAAGIDIRFNGNRLLNYGVGGGHNKRIISGSRQVIGHTDYEAGYHDPLHIDPLATSLNPDGKPLVSRRYQPHKETLLVVPDIAFSNPGGGAMDYLTEISAIKRNAKAIVISAALKSDYPVGLLAANHLDDDDPVYCRPSMVFAKLLETIDQLEPTNNLEQMDKLHQAIQQHSRRIKGIVVISSFRHPASLKLLTDLPPQLHKVAVEVAGEMDYRVELTVTRAAINGQGWFDTNRLAKTHRQKVKQEQANISQTLAQWPYLDHLKVRRDEPDVAGQLVTALADCHD